MRMSLSLNIKFWRSNASGRKSQRVAAGFAAAGFAFFLLKGLAWLAVPAVLAWVAGSSRPTVEPAPTPPPTVPAASEVAA